MSLSEINEHLLTQLQVLNIRSRIMSNDEFHSFTLLPKELRLQIWKLLLPEPTLIRVEHLITRTSPSAPSKVFFHTDIDLPTDNLRQLKENKEMGLLCACNESRELYLEHNPAWLPMVFDGAGRLYFNCRDTIYIESFHRAVAVRNFADAVRTEQWAREMTRLALSARCFDYTIQASKFSTPNHFWGENFKESWWRVLELFPSLEKVEIRGWWNRELSMHGLRQAIENIYTSGRY